MGTARRLKEMNPTLQAIAVQPALPAHGIHGLRHTGTSIVPAIYNPHLADLQLQVETEAAYAMAKQIARDEGLLVGISAAAAVVASLQIAREEAAAGRSSVLAAILPDGAAKYLSEPFWDEP
jgi:cysteine synthase B